MFRSEITIFSHHYKNFKTRYNTAQIMLVIWDPIRLTHNFLQYKIYIKLYKKIIGLVIS